MSGLRQLIDLRFFEPYFLDSQLQRSRRPVRSAAHLQRLLAESSPGGALTFGYPLIEPELVASLTYTRELDRVSTADRRRRSSARPARQRLPAAAAGQPVQRRLHLEPAARAHLRHARQPPLPDQRRLPARLDRSSRARASVATTSSCATASRGASTTRSARASCSSSTPRPAHVTSPTREGVPIFARFFLGGIFDVRGFRFRTIGPRLPLTAITDPNSPPIPNGANIGGNLMYYQNLELEFPIIDEVGIRGVRLHRRRQRLEPRAATTATRPRAARLRA